jgi:hypothetical protein
MYSLPDDGDSAVVAAAASLLVRRVRLNGGSEDAAAPEAKASGSDVEPKNALAAVKLSTRVW